MPRIKALDEIVEQLGSPVSVCWVNAPCGATAAIARFSHRGAVVDLSGSGTFRLIFQLTDTEVETGLGAESLPRQVVRVGSVNTSFTLRRERIRILTAADTLHMFFSPELAEYLGAQDSFCLSSRLQSALRASAVRALVAMNQAEGQTQLECAVSSVERALAQDQLSEKRPANALRPQSRRAVRSLLDERVWEGVSVPELAQAAGLSLHHFIKVCRRTEGFTPHALLLQKRMERAIALLTNPRTRVDEVAMALGFSSPSHFASAFHRLIGVTPAAFREAVANQ